MILKLRNRKIEVIKMKVPLSTERFNIMIDFEPGTQHLKPRIYIDDVEYLEGVLNKLKIKRTNTSTSVSISVIIITAYSTLTGECYVL